MKKKKKFLILAISVILFLALSAASVIFTERPKFCASCHIMTPYYAAWKESAHNQVSCLDCHYEPGLKAHVQGKINGLVQVAQYLTHRYSGKPHAQVSDASCLREGCHEKEAIRDKEITYQKVVSFKHAKHLDVSRADIQLRCTSCHMQLTCDKHMSVEKGVCFTCHFKNVPQDKLGEQCLKCHAKIKDMDSHKEYLASSPDCLSCHFDAKKGDGAVREQLCYFCHSEKEKIAKLKDHKLMHQSHIEKHKVDCISCHEAIGHN